MPRNVYRNEINSCTLEPYTDGVRFTMAENILDGVIGLPYWIFCLFK